MKQRKWTIPNRISHKIKMLSAISSFTYKYPIPVKENIIDYDLKHS